MIDIKKELLALSLLLALIGAAVWNLFFLHRMTESIRDDIFSSREYAAAGDYSDASEKLDAALDIWLSSESYTHIFIRHSEIDGTTDAFYDLKSALLSCDDGYAGAYEKLEYHIDSIEGMEQFTLGSIF